MTVFYDDMRGIASDLLSKFSQGVIAHVRMAVVSGVTPDAPSASVATVTTLAGAVARGVQYKYVTRGLAVATDLQVTFAGDALATPPTIHDFIEVDGVRLKIVQIVPKPAAGTPVVYTLICRK